MALLHLKELVVFLYHSLLVKKFVSPLRVTITVFNLFEEQFLYSYVFTLFAPYRRDLLNSVFSSRAKDGAR